jgi:hypothetical protein
MRFSKVVEDVLVNSSLSLTAGVNLFVGDVPADRDNIVVITDTTPAQINERNYVYHYPSFQIYVRNIKYADGYDLIDAILNELDKKVNFDFTDPDSSIEWHVVSIQIFSGPFVLGRDENDRSQFTINFNGQIELK